MQPSSEGASIITQPVVAGPDKAVMASAGIEPGGGDETAPVHVVSGEHKWTKGNPQAGGRSFNDQEMVVVVADFGRSSAKNRPSVRLRVSPRCGEPQAPAGFLEEPEAKIFGQFRDPAANGAVGQCKFVGGRSNRSETKDDDPHFAITRLVTIENRFAGRV